MPKYGQRALTFIDPNDTVFGYIFQCEYSLPLDFALSYLNVESKRHYEFSTILEYNK